MLPDLLLRLRALLRRDVVEREIDDEIAFHLERQSEVYCRQGLDEREANRRARLELGGVDQTREQYRDSLGVRVVDELIRDIRYSAGALRRAPGFTAVIVFTLAFGIGANAAIFSVVDATLLAPLPYSKPDRLVVVRGPGPGWFVGFGGAEGLHLNPVLAENSAFREVAVAASGGVNLGGDHAEWLRAGRVNASFFSVLGIKPALGRMPESSEIRAGERVVVLSDRLWRTHFDANPSVLGRWLRLDGEWFKVVGVTPPRVDVPQRADLWIPANTIGIEEGVQSTIVFARLTRGVIAAQARRSVIEASRRESRANGQDLGPSILQTSIVPFGDAMTERVRPLMLLLASGAFLVLLVSCCTAASLLLSRLSARRTEFGVRRTIGASRSRLMRQVVLEGVLVATLACVVAIPGTHWTLDAIRLLVPATVLGTAPIGMNVRVVAMTAGVSVLTVLAFAVLPALSMYGGGSGTQEPSSAASQRWWTRTRSGLVIAEVALALILLVTAATLLQTINTLTVQDDGFAADRTLIARMRPTSPQTGEFGTRQWQQQSLRLAQRLEHEISVVPGVAGVGAVDSIFRDPSRFSYSMKVGIDNRELPAEQAFARVVRATPGYFAAAGVRLVAGRVFVPRDTVGPSETMVNERYVRALGLTPGEILGRHLYSEPSPARRRGFREIVGVVSDTRLEGPDATFVPAVYVPLTEWIGTSFEVIVRGRTDPHRLAGPVRNATAMIDPDLPLFNVETFAELRDSHFTERRFAMTMLLVFAVLASGLATTGLYGGIAYLVELRTREIGIRLALGATRSDMLRQVLASGLRHAAMGVIVGTFGGIIACRIAARQIHGFGQVQPTTVVALAGFVVFVTLLATWIPARRAALVDPMTAIRRE
jgi:putative ABC transport system permease protein